MFILDFRNMIILFCCVIENPYYTRAVKNMCSCIFNPISYYNEDQKLLEKHYIAVTQATRNLSYHIKIPEKCNV